MTKFTKYFWLIPGALFALLVHQSYIAISMQNTLNSGFSTMAKVRNLEVKDMVAQSHGLVELEVPLKDGGVLVKKMTIPAAWVYTLGKRTLNEMPVHVLPGTGEEVIMDDIARVQMRTLMINIAILILFILMTAGGVLVWLQYLKKHGDPAQRHVPDAIPV
ncbi:MAG: hypothetical protein JNN12_06595 [Bacteroidetes Order II. Incertae sedis bacterium]|nr:hypothetical protein [Bacteroidetes Order II. bacterium]